jgi:hypothetical protein
MAEWCFPEAIEPSEGPLPADGAGLSARFLQTARQALANGDPQLVIRAGGQERPCEIDIALGVQRLRHIPQDNPLRHTAGQIRIPDDPVTNRNNRIPDDPKALFLVAENPVADREFNLSA